MRVNVSFASAVARSQAMHEASSGLRTPLTILIFHFSEPVKHSSEQVQKPSTQDTSFTSKPPMPAASGWNV